MSAAYQYFPAHHVKEWVGLVRETGVKDRYVKVLLAQDVDDVVSVVQRRQQSGADSLTICKHNYSGGSNTEHSNSEPIRKPNVLLFRFRMVRNSNGPSQQSSIAIERIIQNPNYG